VSQRLLELHALLGGGADIDVIWMVTREPTLLTASKHQLISRLMAMKVGCTSSSSSSGTGMSVRPGVGPGGSTLAAVGLSALRLLPQPLQKVATDPLRCPALA
jgi:hypothetical protein